MQKRKPLINIKLLLYAIGSLLLLEAGCMLIPLFTSIYFQEPQLIGWFKSIGITLATAVLFRYPFRKNHGEWGKREGYVVVTTIWIWYSIFSAIAFRLTGTFSTFTDAFFESVSGFTTTGASICSDVEQLAHSALVWRSFMQWLGGMGIILLSLIFGFGGVQTYVAEATGPVKTRMSPRLHETAMMLWGYYAISTIFVIFLLLIGGMGKFDALCHAWSTISTGGFSTKNASIGYWDSAFIHYVVIFAVLFSSLNYSLTYFFFHGKFKLIGKDEETRRVFQIFFFLIIAVCLGNVLTHQGGLCEKNIRNSIFMTISSVTGTGFMTENFMDWHPALWSIILIIMAFGGSSGSTTGGIKIVRITVLIKNSIEEFKRLLHPRAILPLKISDKVISMETINNVSAFVSLYIIIVLMSTLVFIVLGIGPTEAMGVAMSCVGNVGLGFGEVATGNFYIFNPAVKWFMCALMIIGRLEIFTVLFIFTPTFWKR